MGTGCFILFHALNTRIDDMQGRFNDLQGRFGDLTNRVASLEATLAQRLTAIENRLTTLEGRLDHKASNWLVSFQTAWVTTVIGTATAIIKLWP